MAEATTLQALQKALGKSGNSRETNKRIKVPFAREAIGTPMADVYIRPASRGNEMEAVGKSSLLEFIQEVSPAIQKALNTYNEVQDEKKTYEFLDEYTKRRAEVGSKGFSAEENDFFNNQISGRSLKMQRFIADRLADVESGNIWNNVQARINSEKLFTKTGEEFRAKVQQITSEETQKFIGERPYLSGLMGFSSTVGSRLQNYENGAVNNHLASVNGNLQEQEVNNAVGKLVSSLENPPTPSLLTPPPVATEVDKETNLPLVTDASTIPAISFGNNTGSAEHFSKLDPDFKTRVSAMSAKFFNKTGSKLQLNSSFRDPKENKRVGGVAKSRHLSGEAVDFPPHQIQQLKELGLLEEFGFEDLSRSGHPEHVQNKKGYKQKDKITANAAKVNAPVLTGIDAQVASFQFTVDSVFANYQNTAVNPTDVVMTALGSIRNPDLLVAIGERINLGTGKLSATVAWVKADMPNYIQKLYTYQYQREVSSNQMAEGRKEMALGNLKNSLLANPTDFLNPPSQEEYDSIGGASSGLSYNEYVVGRTQLGYNFRNSTRLDASQIEGTSLNIYRSVVDPKGNVVKNWKELVNTNLRGRQLSLSDHDEVYKNIESMVTGAERSKLPLTRTIAKVVLDEPSAVAMFVSGDVKNEMTDHILLFVKGLEGNKILGVYDPTRVKQVQDILAAKGGYLNLDDSDHNALGGILRGEMEAKSEARKVPTPDTQGTSSVTDSRGRKVGITTKK